MIVDGPVLVTPPPVAWRLWRMLQPTLRRVRETGATIDPELAQYLGDLKCLADRAVPIETATLATQTTGSGCEGWTMTAMSTAEVAEILGTTRSNVTARARRGSLPGWRVGKSWVFDGGAIERLLAEAS